MNNHAESEHQYNCVHIKSDCIDSVQNIENTVIAEVNNQ